MPEARIESSSGNQFLGRFQNGKAVGTFWIGMKGDGYLHGRLSEEGLVTGKFLEDQ